MPRHDFKATIKRILAERVGFHCSNPSCGVSTVGPSIIPEEKEYTGVAAHICSASVADGPRADPLLSEEERSSINNALHLCTTCSVLIDKNDGRGYSVEVLRKWKYAAETVAKARVYQKTPYLSYKEIDFSFLEKDYSTALMCSGLNEKNVNSCPSNSFIIDAATTNLNLAYKCLLKGDSGSGKSILTYQVAFEFSKVGWSVFEIQKNLITENFVFVTPRDKSFLIIDDAQTLDPRHLERILNSAHENCVVLANWNSSTKIDSEFLHNYPCFEIAPYLQVELLKDYCEKNKESISKKLSQLGLCVNEKDHFNRIESRIYRASQEKTPWLFNYHLTEGWTKAKQDYALLRGRGNLNLVIVTVAIFQIATLDKGVSESVVLSALKEFNHNDKWLSSAQEVISQYCVKQDDLIKNKHYEYSMVILKNFTSQKNYNEEFKYLVNVITFILRSSEFLSGHTNIIEYVLFDFSWGKFELNRSGVITEIATDLLSDKESTDYLPQKISKLHSLILINKEILTILDAHVEILENWMLLVCRESAYQLSNLCNTLYNHKFKNFPSSKLLIDIIIKNIIESDIKDKSRFACLINRSYLLYSEDERLYANESLSNSSFSISLSANSSSVVCYQFSSLMHNLNCISNSWTDIQIENSIEGMASLLNNNLMKAYEDLSDLMDHNFGIIGSILGNNISGNKKLVKKCITLSNKILTKSVVDGFESVEAVDVQKYSFILMFFRLYNKNKLKEISEEFNYKHLESLFKSDSKLDQHHSNLIKLLYNPECDNYQKHLDNVINNFNYIDRLFVALSPELSHKKLHSGVRYNLYVSGYQECDSELEILKMLNDDGEDEEGTTLVRRILNENSNVLSEAIFSKVLNSDQTKSKFDILVFIHFLHPDLYVDIFNDTSKNIALTEKIARLIKGSKKEKLHAKLYVNFLDSYSREIIPQLADLKNRYRSISNFDINEFSSN